MKTIGFIGGGRITKILLQGFKNANISFETISVYETNSAVLSNLKSVYPKIEVTATDPTIAASSDLVFIALHPPMLLENLPTFKGAIQHNALVVSLAPKITIEKLKTALPQIPNIARMNPNAGTYVNKGYNPVCFASSVDKSIMDTFIAIFEKLGKVPVVAENKIEAYAVISAMGPTYFNFQIQKLKELAVSFGMDGTEAEIAISNMLWGTTETLFNSGLTFAEVADLVPVKPIAEVEETIKGYYDQYLTGIYNKIKP
jgi:pyrroline-5-carboxylate reductase